MESKFRFRFYTTNSKAHFQWHNHKDKSPKPYVHNTVNLTTTHEHLGMILDLNFGFGRHFESSLRKKSRTNGLLWTLQEIFPETTLTDLILTLVTHDKTFN